MADDLFQTISPTLAFLGGAAGFFTTAFDLMRGWSWVLTAFTAAKIYAK